MKQFLKLSLTNEVLYKTSIKCAFCGKEMRMFKKFDDDLVHICYSHEINLDCPLGNAIVNVAIDFFDEEK